MQDGGPIGLIQNGDIITIDVKERRMDVQLTDDELAERRKKWTAPPYKANKGILFKVCKKKLWASVALNNNLCWIVRKLKGSFLRSVHKVCSTCIERLCDRWVEDQLAKLQCAKQSSSASGVYYDNDYRPPSAETISWMRQNLCGNFVFLIHCFELD